MALKLFTICIVTITLSGISRANPTKSNEFWKNTPLDGMVEEMRSNCMNGIDSFSCIKLKVISFLDAIFKKDIYQLSDDIQIRHNGLITNEITGRSTTDGNIMDVAEDYLKSHDVSFDIPIVDSKITISPKNIDENELSINVQFNGKEQRSSGVEARKSKLKKVIIPIMVFVLLKAMTLIPLAVGILGLKAWNALQLAFFSFVISVGLAIFQLCKKLAIDHHHPQIAAHGPWDGRSLPIIDELIPDLNAQNLAYNAYNIN